jgi:hypothetical protein
VTHRSGSPANAFRARTSPHTQHMAMREVPGTPPPLTPCRNVAIRAPRGEMIAYSPIESVPGRRTPLASTSPSLSVRNPPVRPGKAPSFSLFIEKTVRTGPKRPGEDALAEVRRSSSLLRNGDPFIKLSAGQSDSTVTTNDRTSSLEGASRDGCPEMALRVDSRSLA